MKRRIFALGTAMAAMAQAGAPEAAAQGTAAADVRAANAAFDAALSRRDIAAIAALCVQDGAVMAVHPRDKRPIVGWEAVRRSWEEVFARFPELAVDMPEPTIRLSGDVAIVTGLETIRGRRGDGVAVAFEAMTTNVFERRDGGRWLMVHHHATMMPA